LAEHHHHAPASFTRAFAIGISLNLAYVLGETFYGLLAHSLALLADAGHNLGDVLGLAAAWLASSLGSRRPSARYTYGLRRSSILAALGNAIVLLIITGGVSWEALRRLAAPEPANPHLVMAVAAVGIAINGATALMFLRGRQHDLNLRAAFAHMAADALVALGVVIGGALMLATHWLWLDPVLSLAISAIIVLGTWSLLKDSLNLALDAVPAGIDSAEVLDFLKTQPGVATVHDLHIWPMSTSETALTCHCLMPAGHPGDAFLVHLSQELHAHFDIDHTTIQIETDPAIACELESDRVV
jgi:cobalt-zinc-cadmium efflux system protein